MSGLSNKRGLSAYKGLTVTRGFSIAGGLTPSDIRTNNAVALLGAEPQGLALDFTTNEEAMRVS